MRGDATSSGKSSAPANRDWYQTFHSSKDSLIFLSLPRRAPTADAVGARLGSDKKIKLSFDEWNVWYQSRFAGAEDFPLEVASPRIEDVYGTVDAVVVGDLLITLLNNVDRITVACQAQLVNVIAPIMTKRGGPSWRQTI